MTIHVNGYLQIHKHRGQAALTAPAIVSLTTQGTYYRIAGSWADGSADHFTLDPTGTLTFTGPDSSVFLFTGASDLSVSTAAEVAYVLYINGAPLTSTITPHTFLSASKVSNVSATRIITLNHNDEIEVWATSSDTDSVVLTAETLAVTFWGK